MSRLTPASGSPAPAPPPGTFADLVGRPLLRQRHVDFVVPALGHDLLASMYLTPALAPWHPSGHIQAAHHTLCDFMSRASHYLGVPGQLARAHADRMFAAPEGVELGFGYARRGWRGTGWGDGDFRDATLDFLARFSELRAVLPVYPDALTLTPGVGLDRMGDLVVAVCKPHLAAFTAECAGRYQFAAACMAPVRMDGAWDPATSRFGPMVRTLPSANGRRGILLAPADLVRSAVPVHPAQYARYVYGGGRMSKLELLQDSERHPGRLREFLDWHFSNPHRFRPRRMFRRP